MKISSTDTQAGKRAMPEYESNPSLPVVSQKTRTGTRRITNRSGDKCMIVSAETGEVVAPAGFHEIIEVDRTQFAKLYVGGVSAFNDLSSPGAKVFRMVYNFVLKNPNKDVIYLDHKEAKGMGRATFDRGVVELLTKNIIYKTTRAKQYFLNVDYLYNGDRLALIKEYRLKANSDEVDSDLQGNLPLDGV